MLLNAYVRDGNVGRDEAAKNEIPTLIYEIGESITGNFKAVEELSLRIAPILAQNLKAEISLTGQAKELRSTTRSPLGEELENLLSRLKSLNYSINALMADSCL